MREIRGKAREGGLRAAGARLGEGDDEGAGAGPPGGSRARAGRRDLMMERQ